MRVLLLVSALATAGAAFAGPPPQQQAPANLRQALRQYHSGATQSPRHLSADERAELRRQIAEAAKRTQRR